MNYLLFISSIRYLAALFAVCERYFPTEIYAFSLPNTFLAHSFQNNTENLKKADSALQFRFTFPGNTDLKQKKQTVKGLTT